jgi:hypothetical protein
MSFFKFQAKACISSSWMGWFAFARDLAVLMLLACLALPAMATTWGETTIVDPISGKPCKVATPASMGSYIYEWPEKYDQVFFPVTAADGIWACPSGFASVIGDIDLSGVEKQRITAFLAKLDAGERQPASIADRLQRADTLYALRDLQRERRALIHRILAYDFERMAGDSDRSTFHRKAALEIMLGRLADETLSLATRMEYVFVSANYLREFGDPARAERLYSQLEWLITQSTGSQTESYAQYLQSLLVSARTIAPGGRLAPEAEASAPAD